MKKPLLFLLFAFISNLCSAQYFQQYFDGADTDPAYSLIIQFDTASSNIWQVGKPQKTIFNDAYTQPNVIVTDTLNNYPNNNLSMFYFDATPGLWWSWGIMAVRWTQKLDLDKKHDGGIVESSWNHGPWQNIFSDPNVYNLYGFDLSNRDTLITGEYAFSGTDTTWKDIWLCYDAAMYTPSDTLRLRYTLKTDSINNNKEGWMIDNMFAGLTIMHTAKNGQQEKYLKVYPTTTSGIVHIEAEKLLQYHIIESIELINLQGVVVERFGKSPTKYHIDISKHIAGSYFLKITTNMSTETFPIILNKN